MMSFPIFSARAVLTLILLVAAVRAAPAQPAPLQGLDGYIEAAMRDWGVPGLAIAVVRDDSVIFARGYGVRELGGAESVDENTLFAIASTTKAMTAAALGTLVDEGRLGWDDPVSRWLPEFQLLDPTISRDLTVRDLLTHRSGVERADLLWVAAPFDRGEVLRRTRHVSSSAPFRAGYGYQNLMYIAAGEVAGAAAGSTWDDVVEQRLFRPLGMTRSTSRSAVAETRDNVATPHTRVDGRVTPAALRNYDNIGGAGAVFSSALEMAQWIRLHLNGGTYGGQRLIGEATVSEMHTPQTVIRSDTVADRLFPDSHFRAYGLGWFLQDYHGRKLVHHSGSINWTRTQVGMIPSENVGVVVIANLSSSNLQHALMYRVLDAFMGAPQRDWSAEYRALAVRAEERAAARSRETEASRIRRTRPSLALDAYAGTYTDSVFGDVRISRERNRLVLTYAPDYVADLEHWHHDTFRAVWRRAGFGRAFVTFSLDPRGRARTLELEDFGEFRRAPDPRSDAAVAASDVLAPWAPRL
ncbi:MAG: serine hydrolase [Gemmatimonadetes bacterium]|nr:serine hydrolase [Gemmatimonadota bacterium]